MKKRGRSGLIVNLFLLLVIAALYFATSGSDAVQVMASVYAGPAYRGRSADAVALEFAVSWNAAALPDILNVLEQKNTAVTFLVSGAWARENGDLLRRMTEEGHEIGTLGDDPSFDGPLSKVTEDVRRSLEAIEDACGVTPALYYSGERNLAVSARAARKLNLTHILSTVDLRCGAGSAADIIQRGLNEPIIGSIILLQPTKAAAEALSGLIDGLQAKGIRAVRVKEVLYGPV